jgi:DNA topoisomerase-2
MSKTSKSANTKLSSSLKKNKNKDELSNKYQKMTDHEHILEKPDTYIGSIEKDENENWIYNPETKKMEFRKFEWVPGLYKCFDEGIVNARDHFIRMRSKNDVSEDSKINHKVKNISITIDKETGVITMLNDGNGIDIEKHPEYDTWIPQMIFGELRTSTNYDNTEKKLTGGKNGFGFKLVLIYSKWGIIETVDHTRKKKYIQRFENNLYDIKEPKITKCSTKPYTKVSWLPDYKRFGITGLIDDKTHKDDIYNLLTKRIYDVGAVTDKTVKVKFNNELIPIKTFEDYVNMYVGKKSETKRIYERCNERWEYSVCLTPLDEFAQVSFVNGINTHKGGKHVDYILTQITNKLIKYIEKKKKVRVKSSTIKEQLMLFINCDIENPKFESQTKDYLSTPVKNFGSTCSVSDKFIEKVAKLGIMEIALSLNDIKTTNKDKKTDGKKTTTVRGIPKLIDANKAGTKESNKCILIICEGDSAKAGIVSGLSKKDRDYYGVYPLKGKLLNIRNSSLSDISSNKEITELKKIIGLETNKKYKTAEDISKFLRYGKVLIITDQDLDGSHIKGLCINMFDTKWRELLKINSFIGFMNTPIIKAKKGKNQMVFYNEKEYNTWKNNITNLKSWNIKYYKGLGTSGDKEFKEYFKNKKIVWFNYNEDTCNNSIDMVFNKERADERKLWLSKYDKNISLDTSSELITITDFIHSEMIHYSKYDCDRSIPNIVDGLKISLRKILFGAFKRNLVKEIKVAQLVGYVSEHSGYHHGENSLVGAIIKLAREFVGSNNISLLQPNGQFGSRLQGGKDHSAERYIFTELSPITKKIFPPEDNKILNYLNDDGQIVEPEFYVPIIPMILVNGSVGIGTGSSTNILQYNPRQIIKYLLNYLNNSEEKCIIEPYYHGFKGTITKFNKNEYLVKGIYKKIKNDVIHITELPVGTWTENFKELLEKMMDTQKIISGKTVKKQAIVKKYVDMSTNTDIDITVTLHTGIYEKLMEKKVDKYGINGLEKQFKLVSKLSTKNMNMFDQHQQLRKFDNIYDIIETFIGVRMEYYKIRKEYILNKLKLEKNILENKAKFVQMQCDNELDLRQKSNENIIKLLSDLKFDTIKSDKQKFDYLRSMRTDSVSLQNIEKLLNERDLKIKEYKTLKNKTLNEIWIEELNELDVEYTKYIKMRDIRNDDKSKP